MDKTAAIRNPKRSIQCIAETRAPTTDTDAEATVTGRNATKASDCKRHRLEKAPPSSRHITINSVRIRQEQQQTNDSYSGGNRHMTRGIQLKTLSSTNLDYLGLPPDTLRGAMDMLANDLGDYDRVDEAAVAVTREVRGTMEEVLELLTAALPAEYR
jgi:hypothetical protein